MAYRRDEMWSERYEYERLPRERLPPRPDEDYHRVVSFASKKPSLPERPGEEGYSRYEYGHAHVGYRDYGEGRGFAHERRSGLPHRIINANALPSLWRKHEKEHRASEEEENSFTNIV